MCTTHTHTHTHTFAVSYALPVLPGWAKRHRLYGLLLEAAAWPLACPERELGGPNPIEFSEFFEYCVFEKYTAQALLR